MKIHLRDIQQYSARSIAIAFLLLNTTGSQVVIANDSGGGFFLNVPALLMRSGDDVFTLQRDIHFVDNQGKQWLAPVRTVTDGASIPAPFLGVIGERTDARFLNAAIIHDAYCARRNADLAQYHSENWEKVHRMFYEALLANGTPQVTAKVMYAAVYLVGPRWDQPSRSLEGTRDDLLAQELRWCRKWIVARNPSPEEIVQWMEQREAGLQANDPVEPDWTRLLNGPS